MKYKKIIKPDINPLILNTFVVDWNFRPSITTDHEKYCIRYEITFADGSKKKKQLGGFSLLKEANKVKEELILQLNTGTYVPYHFTVKEFYDYWLYYYMIDEKKIAYSAFLTYRNIIYNYLLKEISPDMDISQIESTHLIKFMDSIDSDSIRSNAYAVIGSSFSTAKKCHIINRNPAPFAVQTIRTKMKQNKKAALKRTAFSLQQLQNILLTCKSEEPDYYLLMLICATTGIRISEALGLQFENVDYFNCRLHIVWQKGRTIQGDGWESHMATSQLIRPKTYSSIRSVELPQFVLDEIILAKTKYDYLIQNDVNFHYTSDFVIVNSIGKPLSRDSNISHAFKHVLELCGIDSEKYHWHDLRHTYATLLKKNINNLKVISKMLGHATTNMTEEVYIDNQKEVIDLCNIMNNYADDLTFQVRKNDEKIAQQDFDMAKMVDFLT